MTFKLTCEYQIQEMNIFLFVHAGRDSIRAMLASNLSDTSNSQAQTEDQRDNDLIVRLKEQLDDCEYAPNLDVIRNRLKEIDKSKCGKVPSDKVS